MTFHEMSLKDTAETLLKEGLTAGEWDSYQALDVRYVYQKLNGNFYITCADGCLDLSIAELKDYLKKER